MVAILIFDNARPSEIQNNNCYFPNYPATSQSIESKFANRSGTLALSVWSPSVSWNICGISAISCHVPLTCETQTNSSPMVFSR